MMSRDERHPEYIRGVTLGCRIADRKLRRCWLWYMTRARCHQRNSEQYEQ